MKLPKLVSTICIANHLIFSLILFGIFSFQSGINAQTSKNVIISYETGELPKEIEIVMDADFFRKIDSVINVSQQQKDISQEVKSIHYKAFALLQQKNSVKAKETYLEALKILNTTEYHLTKVKILAGLGEVAILEGNTASAQDYFAKARNIAKTNAYSAGINWILYHGGENFIESYVASENELSN